MLGLGLTLFCLRAIRPGVQWKELPLKWAFWLLNIGLTLMSVLSMFPIGIQQAIASIQTGVWYARSAQFMQRPEMQTLRWMRVPGDVIFTIGTVILALFVIGLITGHSYEKSGDQNVAQVEEGHVLVAGD